MAQDAGILNPTTSNLASERTPNDHFGNRGTECRRFIRKLWQPLEKWWEVRGFHWRNPFHLPKNEIFAKNPEANASTSSSNQPRAASVPSSLVQSSDSNGIEGGVVPELPNTVPYSSCSVGSPRIPSVKTLGTHTLAPGQKPVEQYKTVFFIGCGELPITQRRLLLDTGSDANLMVESTQKLIGAELKPCKHVLTWGDDREPIIHIGEVKVNWYFEGKGKIYTTTFVVVEDPSWFDTLLGLESINEYNVLLENGRVCPVRQANQSRAGGGSCNE